MNNIILYREGSSTVSFTKDGAGWIVNAGLFYRIAHVAGRYPNPGFTGCH